MRGARPRASRGGGEGPAAVATTAASRVDQQTTSSEQPAASSMVYESDFYTTRRSYGRPSYSSYSVTTPSYTSTVPRHYVVLDAPDRPRRAEEQYSYSYTQTSEERRVDDGRPKRSYSSAVERVERSAGSGPGSYSYSTERSSRSSDYPGSYHSSYSSTTSGRLPGGTTYRHFSYRV